MLPCKSSLIIHNMFSLDVILPVLRDKASLNKITDYEIDIRKMDEYCVSTGKSREIGKITSGNRDIGERITAIK
jgi:hypothetical protein